MPPTPPSLQASDRTTQCWCSGLALSSFTLPSHNYLPCLLVPCEKSARKKHAPRSSHISPPGEGEDRAARRTLERRPTKISCLHKRFMN
eukprot:758747-Hanusia_phi.AAC.2